MGWVVSMIVENKLATQGRAQGGPMPTARVRPQVAVMLADLIWVKARAAAGS